MTADALRDALPRVVAAVARRTRDLDLAEDMAQEAAAIAADRWPRDGMPDDPTAWLVTTAWRRALNELRRRETAARRIVVYGGDADGTVPSAELQADLGVVGDERLELLFACCHPALRAEVRVALTLRAVAGLTTEEVAAAFLVPTATLAQRLVRAKRKLRDAGVSFALPPAERLAERSDDVRLVLYLLTTEAHAASGGERTVRADLMDEAIALTRLLDGRLPDQPETLGLLALQLFLHARGRARETVRGRAIRLEDQDRQRYDARLVGEAERVLDRAARHRRPGPYQLQATIAGVHAMAPSAEATDWATIAALYARLEAMTPTAVVRVNRAVAVGRAALPTDGLALLDDLDEADVARYGPYWAARGALEAQAGNRARAATAWAKARTFTANGGLLAALADDPPAR